MTAFAMNPSISDIPEPSADRDRVHNAARDLALGYQRFVSGCWRGDDPDQGFGERLTAYWRTSMPAEPREAPDAISPHGGGGKGIRWFLWADEVLGFVPGARGGYRIPRGAVVPMVRSTRACGCAAPIQVRGLMPQGADVPVGGEALRNDGGPVRQRRVSSSGSFG